LQSDSCQFGCKGAGLSESSPRRREKCLDPAIFQQRETPIRQGKNEIERETSFKGDIMVVMERRSSTLTTTTIMVQGRHMAMTGIGRKTRRLAYRAVL
jgi:hypothetical protein